MPLDAAEGHINDFIALRHSMLVNGLSSKFGERASLNATDVIPDMILTETLYKLETSVEEGCAMIHY